MLRVRAPIVYIFTLVQLVYTFVCVWGDYMIVHLVYIYKVICVISTKLQDCPHHKRMNLLCFLVDYKIRTHHSFTKVANRRKTLLKGPLLAEQTQ